MSSRPVPRRYSPWGLPDGDTRQPQAHRCNDRAEDVIQACFEGNPFKTVPGPFKLFWRCMRSKPGEEPTEPFFYLDLDPPQGEEKLGGPHSSS
ncbi:hexokinase-1 protein [Wolffia australiana]